MYAQELPNSLLTNEIILLQITSITNDVIFCFYIVRMLVYDIVIIHSVNDFRQRLGRVSNNCTI